MQSDTLEEVDVDLTSRVPCESVYCVCENEAEWRLVWKRNIRPDNGPPEQLICQHHKDLWDASSTRANRMITEWQRI